MITNEIVNKLRSYLISGMFTSKEDREEDLHLNAEEVRNLLEYIKYLEDRK